MVPVYIYRSYLIRTQDFIDQSATCILTIRLQKGIFMIYLKAGKP